MYSGVPDNDFNGAIVFIALLFVAFFACGDIGKSDFSPSPNDWPQTEALLSDW